MSPIGDAGWTFQHDQGRKQMEAALGGKVQTKYVENVAEGADAERVIRELAQSGNTIIFTTSFGYMNPTEKVAKQFPKVFFMHATGYKSGPNFGNYNARFYEGRYLTGVIAGSTTLLLTGGYLMLVAGAGFVLREFGGSWGRALQSTLVFAALLLLAVVVGVSCGAPGETPRIT